MFSSWREWWWFCFQSRFDGWTHKRFFGRSSKFSVGRILKLNKLHTVDLEIFEDGKIRLLNRRKVYVPSNSIPGRMVRLSRIMLLNRLPRVTKGRVSKSSLRNKGILRKKRITMSSEKFLKSIVSLQSLYRTIYSLRLEPSPTSIKTMKTKRTMTTTQCKSTMSESRSSIRMRSLDMTNREHKSIQVLR